MFTALKTGVFGGVGYTLIGTVIGDVAAEVVAIVAGLTALGWIWQKLLKPTAKAVQRTHEAVGALEGLESFMRETRTAVQQASMVAAEAKNKAEMLDLRLDLIERHIGLFAAEDAVRARAAMEAAVRAHEWSRPNVTEDPPPK